MPGDIVSDVPDPTDFPPASSAPGLRALDTALRCPICSELYDAPVTITCGHCFCSACIRTHIGQKEECPTCRQPAKEMHIRTNPSMEECISAWKDARSCVLRLIADQTERSKRPPKKRKLSEESSDDEIEVVSGPSTLSLRKPSEKDEVDCPICGEAVPMKAINSHIDSGCNTSTSSKPTSQNDARNQWLKIMSGQPSIKDKDLNKAEPLPKASYSVLKDKQIKALLVDNNLSTTGDRNTCIARHERYVVLYNANLDRAPSQRSSTAALRNELKKWEEDGKKARKNVVHAKDIDTVAHEKANRTQFEDLIEAARPKKASPATETHVTGERNNEAIC